MSQLDNGMRCDRIFVTAGIFGVTLPSLEWVAKVFVDDDSPESYEELLAALREERVNREWGLTTVIVPANFSGRRDRVLVPAENIEANVSTERFPPIVSPGSALRQKYGDRLVLVMAWIEDGRGPRGTVGWKLMFRVADRDPFPAGSPDRSARCDNPAFTVLAGDLVEEMGPRDEYEDVYSFDRSGNKYAVIAWPDAGRSAREIASLLVGTSD